MDSSKMSETKNDKYKKKNNKILKEDFNFEKYNKLFESANDFFEAAVRCSFDDSFKSKRYPMMIPNLTNRALSCELYLKATLYLTKNELHTGHKLKQLFSNLDKDVQKEIYDIWRTTSGENIPDDKYTKDMFDINLEVNSDVFTRFRYVHEWARASISLQNSLTEKQFHLHPFNVNRPIGSPSIYDGFLEQFAITLQKYNSELVRLKIKE